MPIVSAWRARQLPMSQPKNGVDCLVLRAISDNCDEAYDAICEREFDLFEYARVASDITLDIVRRIAAAQ